jgi:signal peptidase II
MTARRAWTLFALALFVFLVDYLSKAYVHAHIPLLGLEHRVYPYGGIPVLRDWFGVDFSINHAINRGAAWGAFAEYQDLLLYLRIAIIGGVVAYLIFVKTDGWAQTALSLVLAGAAGNVFDTFYYGYVIDLFLFRFGSYYYPLFNVADASIFVGVMLLLLRSFKRKEQTS